MDNINIVYRLTHIYETDDFEKIKEIGFFSSYRKAEEVINDLVTQPGFREYPRNCFEINETKIDRYGWKEGFFTWE